MRGEIWIVDLDPVRGQEIRKSRPCVVISSDGFESIPIRIVIPVTSWQPKFAQRAFMVRIPASESHGLLRDSGANVLQIRSLSTERFMEKLGQLDPPLLQEVLAALVVAIDYEET
ncbi:MAG: type II toxin-antitoxin system toxin endoribonuclease MazF9 [Synechococcales cyanobacterium]